ncbi:MAG TPA: hypothetical protein VIH96_11860, partial [Paraburkholderia sp.]
PWKTISGFESIVPWGRSRRRPACVNTPAFVIERAVVHRNEVDRTQLPCSATGASLVAFAVIRLTA